MVVNRIAENVLGTMGAVCWMGQLLPQVWKSWRNKSTKGLSSTFLFSWGLAAGFLGIYNLAQNLNIPLIIQPQLFCFLSILSWAQCLHYGSNWSTLKSTCACIGVLLLIGGFEAGMVFAVRGHPKPVMAFGILSSVFLSLALLPQYWEIYKHGEVIGISLLFVFIDLMGGVFSDLSLAFKDSFDIFAGIAYTLVVVLDLVVLICAITLNPRAQRRRRQAGEIKAAGQTLNMETMVESQLGPRLVQV